MRIAVVAGGWHWPLHFFQEIAVQAEDVDLFAVSHRHPELPVVVEEKAATLRRLTGSLGDIDRKLYRHYATLADLEALGWEYSEAPNTCGDWCFLDQWLQAHDFREYGAVLSVHDDTWIRRRDLFEYVRALKPGWLLLANGSNAVEPADYVRGSFEFFSRELLEMLGGRIPLGDVKLTREGKTDSPASREELQPWNDTCFPLRRFLVDRGLDSRIARLSPYYRVSPWAIEGERGFIHRQGGGPWSMAEGLKAYPL